MHRFIKINLCGIAIAIALAMPPVVGLAAEPVEQPVQVFINQVLKPYTLIKKIS